LHYLVSLVFYIQLWTHCNDFRFLCKWQHSSCSLEMRVELHRFESHMKQFFSFNNFLNAHCIIIVSRSQTSFLAQGVITCSISGPAFLVGALILQAITSCAKKQSGYARLHCIVEVTNTELRDINRLMGYRDVQ